LSAPFVDPKTFKDSIGKFNDHFKAMNNTMHRSYLHSFLAAFEDLNRIVDKPASRH
jgi:hypothetical protein